MRHLEVERDDGQVTVEVDVTNTGQRTGAQVVQVYVGHPADTAVPEPPHQLGGFLKVTLRPGQTQHVRIRLAARAFSYWDVTKHDFVVPDGTYRVFAGSSPRDLPVSAPVRVRGLRVPAARIAPPSRS